MPVVVSQMKRKISSGGSLAFAEPLSVIMYILRYFTISENQEKREGTI